MRNKTSVLICVPEYLHLPISEASRRIDRLFESIDLTIWSRLRRRGFHDGFIHCEVRQLVATSVYGGGMVRVDAKVQ